MQQPITSYNHPDFNDLPPQFPPDCASAWGEDSYGIWFELNTAKVVQRFRWIPKGEFTMGSPETEKGRGIDETLHEVTLTRGFWLADTTCTQELWQAVMQDGSPHLKSGLQNPIESISWLDVQQFLIQLNTIIPGLQCGLLTEAQWEYACRAGTTTPFSFGDMITPEQVNYDGDHPYADGEKGGCRNKTVAVKSLPANAWGLYEMHGNVFEWCFDEWNDNLGREAVTDPVTAVFKSDVIAVEGADRQAAAAGNKLVYDIELLENAEDGGVKHLLRGGSWPTSGSSCRSASRARDHADGRIGGGGFRLVLGH